MIREAHQILHCGDNTIADDRLYVMGILNVTPDSFSDGGIYHNKDRAVDHALRMRDEGADIIDVGGVATSPHLRPEERTSSDEEKRRVLPVIEELAKRGLRQLAVDTMRASVAEAALNAGASWINDQSAGLVDVAMPAIMAK